MIKLQQASVKILGLQVHQAGSGIIGSFGPCLPREPEADIILTGQNPPDVGVHLRLLFLQPSQQGRRLTGQGALQGEAGRFLRRAVPEPPADHRGGAPVGRGDAGTRRTAILPPGVQPFAVAGTAYARNGARGNARLADNLADAGGVRLPKKGHIPLVIPGARRYQRRVFRRYGNLTPLYVEQGRLGHRAAVINPHEIGHVSASVNRSCKKVRARLSSRRQSVPSRYQNSAVYSRTPWRMSSRIAAGKFTSPSP